MIRKIIEINEDKCIGCGDCVEACHEGAIALVNGKARLMRDDYCDGLGDCLPACPTNAITFTNREAAEYDEQAVLAAKRAASVPQAHAGGCPGHQMKQFNRDTPSNKGCECSTDDLSRGNGSKNTGGLMPSSELAQWPAQMKLVPVNAPYFNGAKLLIAADCTAFAYARLHEEFMHGRITLIGCPKLDDIDYSEKLTAIIQNNDIKDVTVIRMEIPCCGGITNAVKTALQNSGKMLPWNVVTISIDGRIL